MKQLQRKINDIMKLIEDSEYYILFNDGKAVRSHLPETIRVGIDSYYNTNDFYKRNKTAFEEEVDLKVPFSSIIEINTDCELKIIHLNDDIEYADYLIMVKKTIEAKIINLYYQVSNNFKTKVEIVCEEDAKLTFKNIGNCNQQTTSMINLFAMENSQIHIDDLAMNNQQLHKTINVFLLEEGIQFDMANVIINCSKTKQIYDYNVTHVMGNSTSNMLNFGIAKNNSELIFNCNGTIQKDAKASNLAQLSRGIILDPTSSIQANPILEIDEFDVMASHGASIGAIDENDLYYLMSRGLTRKESEDLMVKAFVQPFFRDLTSDAIVSYLMEKIETKLQE